MPGGPLYSPKDPYSETRERGYVKAISRTGYGLIQSHQPKRDAAHQMGTGGLACGQIQKPVPHFGEEGLASFVLISRERL